MGASKKVVVSLVLRSTHVALHIATVLLISGGKFMLPNPKKKGKLLEAAHSRAMVWMLLEIFFTIFASVMLVCTLLNCNVTNPANAILLIKEWFQRNCPNFSFFYYVLTSLFVLYGAMIGCNIPMLFNKIQIYPFTYPNRPIQTWQVMLIAGVVVGILNSILYFVAAFFPINSNVSDAEQQGKSEDDKDNPKTEEEPKKELEEVKESAEAENVDPVNDDDD